jgi:hypothetical protein
VKTIVVDGVTYELPACPSCGATARRCKRPSGWEAAEWHVSRAELFERANAGVAP